MVRIESGLETLRATDFKHRWERCEGSRSQLQADPTTPPDARAAQAPKQSAVPEPNGYELALSLSLSVSLPAPIRLFLRVSRRVSCFVLGAAPLPLNRSQVSQ